MAVTQEPCLKIAPGLSLLLILLLIQETISISQTISIGNLALSPIAFGTLNLLDKTENNNDATVTRNVLQYLPDGTLIDTAERYGDGRCEYSLGAAIRYLKDNSRKEGTHRCGLLIATKFAPAPNRLDSSSVVEACKQSASRLGVYSIDLYQIHFADIVQPLAFFGIQNVKDEKYWDGLAECYHLGLVKNVGVCNYGPTMVQNAHDALSKRGVPLVSNQINFNLMRYRSSLETKLLCDELGVRVLAYHPLANGILTDKYDLNDISTLSTISKYSRHRMRYFLRGTEKLRETLRLVASDRDVTTGQVAINWVRGKGAIPIVGGKNPMQIMENSESMSFSLSDLEMTLLDEASNESVEYYKGFDLI